MKVRAATSADAGDMADLLNQIIAVGGTTAYEAPFTPDAMDRGYASNPEAIACSVAEDDGRIVGMQALFRPTPGHDLAEGWAFIASFVRIGMTGRGIGSALFGRTLDEARKAGVKVIDATIRSDNAGGLAFYGRMGFVDYDRLIGVPLADGTPLDRVRKRFDIQD